VVVLKFEGLPALGVGCVGLMGLLVKQRMVCLILVLVAERR
jgi:hypothetical protein